jgi:membrane protein DedA with SNARE-associated domain/rhodanese-related sulfurtransferase
MGELHHVLADLAGHGYLVLFGWVAAATLSAPAPAMPILVVAGALTATGRLSFTAALGLAVLACIVGDIVWYGIGRRWGAGVLRRIGRFSFGPETCHQRALDFIARYGGRSMLIAKFLPGIGTFAVPVTAASGIALPAFLLYEIPGSIIYSGTWLLLGRTLGHGFERSSRLAHFSASASIGVAALAAAAVVTFRYARRRNLRRRMQTARITPGELHDLILRGKDPLIVDLRHPLDMLPDPRMIAGAVRLSPEELSAQHVDLPSDREIILYCTCPGEASSADMALRLQALGVTRVRPLLGGFDAWKQLGYPLEDAADKIGWPTQKEPEPIVETLGC